MKKCSFLSIISFIIISATAQTSPISIEHLDKVSRTKVFEFGKWSEIEVPVIINGRLQKLPALQSFARIEKTLNERDAIICWQDKSSGLVWFAPKGAISFYVSTKDAIFGFPSELHDGPKVDGLIQKTKLQKGETLNEACQRLAAAALKDGLFVDSSIKCITFGGLFIRGSVSLIELVNGVPQWTIDLEKITLTDNVLTLPMRGFDDIPFDLSFDLVSFNVKSAVFNGKAFELPSQVSEKESSDATQ